MREIGEVHDAAEDLKLRDTIFRVEHPWSAACALPYWARVTFFACIDNGVPVSYVSLRIAVLSHGGQSR